MPIEVGTPVRYVRITDHGTEERAAQVAFLYGANAIEADLVFLDWEDDLNDLSPVYRERVRQYGFGTTYLTEYWVQLGTNRGSSHGSFVAESQAA